MAAAKKWIDGTKFNRPKPIFAGEKTEDRIRGCVSFKKQIDKLFWDEKKFAQTDIVFILKGLKK